MVLVPPSVLICADDAMIYHSYSLGAYDMCGADLGAAGLAGTLCALQEAGQCCV
jgi:hypothetical protein